MPGLQYDILLNLDLCIEALRASLNKNKEILKWRQFWNKVHKPFVTCLIRKEQSGHYEDNFDFSFVKLIQIFLIQK